MCCSLAPAQFSKTVLYAAELFVNSQLVHVLGYQNKARNRATGGNAMILPFPAKPGTMTQANVVATDQCPYILDDMALAVQPVSRGMLSFASSAKGVDTNFEIFNSGIYTIVLASDARAIPAALPLIPAAKRPPLNSAVFDAYAKWYPGWAIALCCFNNTEAKKATPMLWWYEPTKPAELFMPALDSHTGDAPNLNEEVEVEHTLVAGSFQLLRGAQVYYQGGDKIAKAVRQYLANQVLGDQYSLTMPNGDFVVDAAVLRTGIFRLERRLPPGA